MDVYMGRCDITALKQYLSNVLWKPRARHRRSFTRNTAVLAKEKEMRNMDMISLSLSRKQRFFRPPDPVCPHIPPSPPTPTEEPPPPTETAEKDQGGEVKEEDPPLPPPPPPPRLKQPLVPSKPLRTNLESGEGSRSSKDKEDGGQRGDNTPLKPPRPFLYSPRPARYNANAPLDDESVLSTIPKRKRPDAEVEQEGERSGERSEENLGLDKSENTSFTMPERTGLERYYLGNGNGYDSNEEEEEEEAEEEEDRDEDEDEEEEDDELIDVQEIDDEDDLATIDSFDSTEVREREFTKRVSDMIAGFIDSPDQVGSSGEKPKKRVRFVEERMVDVASLTPSESEVEEETPTRKTDTTQEPWDSAIDVDEMILRSLSQSLPPPRHEL